MKRFDAPARCCCTTTSCCVVVATCADEGTPPTPCHQARVGHSIDVRWVRPGDPNYIAKYVTDACDERRNVPWLDEATGEVVYGARCRAWTSSRNWGLTMRELRAQQVAWARNSCRADGRREARQGDAGRRWMTVARPGLAALLIPTRRVTQGGVRAGGRGGVVACNILRT